MRGLVGPSAHRLLKILSFRCEPDPLADVQSLIWTTPLLIFRPVVTSPNLGLMKGDQNLGLVDFINSSIRKRHHEEIAIWACFDICDHPKIPADQQAFALRDLMFCSIIRHAVF